MVIEAPVFRVDAEGSLDEGSFPMSIVQLIILGIAAMIGLATLRLTRVHYGRTPLPEGRGRLAFILAFLIVPPVAVGMLIDPAGSAGLFGGATSVLLYVIILAALTLMMGIGALVARTIAPRRSHRFLQLALLGTEGDPDGVAFDPSLTAALAEDVALVDRNNAAFPRGPGFPAQIDCSGFRDAWDALDAATGTLEGRIADEHRLGVAVSSSATATAEDARSRLDTLRRLAISQGPAWAS